MKKLTLLAFALTTCGSIAQATPIATMGTYTASSVAIVEPSLIDTQFGTSPPGGLPLAISAFSSDGINSAFGTGIGDTGFISAGMEISGVNSAASAVGYAEYMGTFTAPDSAFRLRLDFSSNGYALGADATAETVLGLNLMSGLTTLWSFEYHYPLINDTALLNQAFEQSFTLPAGTLADLSVSILTTSSASAQGEAFNLASAQFGLATVPEPSTLLALFAGLALLPLARRRAGAPVLALT